MTVYLIYNTANGKYYVGKTVKSLAARWREHRSDAAGGSRMYLHQAIRKYGPGAFTVHPLMSTMKTDEQLCEQERFLIALFNAQDPAIGYNIADGGYFRDQCGAKNPWFGKHPSAATRAKMSAAQRARTDDRSLSLEARAKMSRAKQGWKIPQETRDKARLVILGNKWSVGRKASAETRAKLSAKLMGNQRLLGHKHTEDTLAKIREAMKRVWTPERRQAASERVKKLRSECFWSTRKQRAVKKENTCAI